jgi:putative selenate reductase molybdopterin-binding subunit
MATAMQGSGVASFELGGASIKLNEDGSFNVMTGATDIGQGSDTILAQIAAEALGVGMDQIIMHSVDTDSSVFDYGSYASSTTYISGGGVKVAADRVRKQVLDVAADMLDCAPEDMSINDGIIYTPRGRSNLTVADIANETLYGKHRQQIMAKGDFWTEDSPAPFFAQFIEVEVDTETGQVRVTKAVNALDLGKAINPTLATGQVEGAVAMALGYALSEEIKFDDQGRVRNPGFVDYKVVSILDMPQMTTILVEDTEYSGPFGAKSAGEVPTNGMAPAVANAIQDALGIRIRSLPITPEKILQALNNLKIK